MIIMKVRDVYESISSKMHMFLDSYKLPTIIFRTTQDVPHDVENTRYMAPEIHKQLVRLKHVGYANNTYVYYNIHKHPQYFIRFVIFYVDMLRSILASMSRNTFITNVKVFLTPAKKVMPKDRRSPLTAVHVNSGVTTHMFGSHEKSVVVYREEEVFKVLMHELVHAYELDMIYMPPSAESSIAPFFNLQGTTLRINESLTDTLACLYNVAMYALISRKSFSALVKKERKYIISKACDVMHFLGYEWNGSHLSKPHHSTEHTHVVSYYILKGLNWYYLEDFLNSYEPWVQQKYVDMVVGFINRQDFWKHSMKTGQSTNRSMKMSSLDISRLVYTKKDKLLKSLLTR